MGAELGNELAQLRRLLTSLGRRAGALAASPRIRVGGFAATTDPRELGRVVSIGTETVDVEFFRSWLSTETVALPIGGVTRTGLWPGTRVYLRNPSRVGVVSEPSVEGDRLWYEVRFPGQQIERIVEDDLRARCMSARADPTDAFVSGAFESQHFHDQRLAAVQAIIAMRSAARGLTGLLSASVQLVPYQLAAVQRIVSDPIQRYLLADEVGMGKTIEAAAVIRQCLLDDPRHKVVVIAPRQLIRQWHMEIESKFSILREFAGRVLLANHDDVGQIDGICELVVVDEAHRLIDTIDVSNPTANFTALQKLAHRAPRLLLVSATPLFGHESSALATLHLLDPASYPLEELDNFRIKLAHRQEIGRRLMELDPQAPSVFSRRTARALRTVCPDDPEMGRLVEGVQNPGLTPSEMRDAVGELYEYTASTYRIYHRVIRGRRVDAPGYFVERKGELLVDPLEDETVGDLKQALEEWRLAARGALLEMNEDSRPVEELRLARYFATLLHAAAQCAAAVVAVRGGRPAFEGEGAATNSILRAVERGDPDDRVRWIAGAIQTEVVVNRKRRERPRIAVFLSETTQALKLAAELSRLGRACQAVVKGMSAEECEKQLFQFREYVGPAVLILDSVGEEGLDLPFVDSLVHCDLPIDPLRVEQRIGRADRFGRISAGVRHRVIVPDDEDDSYWLAWLHLLKDGFGIFDRSVADVHFRLEPLSDQAKIALFRSGADGLRSLVAGVVGQLQDERLRLDEQYALDRQQASDFGAKTDFDELMSQEAVSTTWSRGVRGWLEGVLNLTAEPARDDTFRLRWPTGARNAPYLPENPWKDRFASGLGPLLTFERKAALREKAALMRPGRPLLDEAERQMLWDDRGTVFATWRASNEWTSREPGLFFKFGVFVELPTPVMHPSENRVFAPHGIRFLLDGLMPPWSETVYLDLVGTPIALEDPRRTLLEARYSKQAVGTYRDFNLAGNLDPLHALIAPDALAAAATRAHDAAVRQSRATAPYERWLTRGRRHALGRVEGLMKYLHSRLEVAYREDGAEALRLERELQIFTAVLQSVSDPRVSIDSMGLFVVARRGPHAVLS